MRACVIKGVNLIVKFTYYESTAVDFDRRHLTRFKIVYIDATMIVTLFIYPLLSLKHLSIVSTVAASVTPLYSFLSGVDIKDLTLEP